MMGVHSAGEVSSTIALFMYVIASEGTGIIITTSLRHESVDGSRKGESNGWVIFFWLHFA